MYFNVTTDPRHAEEIWRYLGSTPSDGLPVEGMPCRWTNISSSGRLSWSWFGRLGAGDILARFRWGKISSAHKLLAKVATIFNASGNIYESYNMSGQRAGDTGGNYLEHCGGYAWSVVEGAFGIDFASDREAAATINPRFPSHWPSAHGEFVLRGAHIAMDYRQNSSAGVTFQRLRKDLLDVGKKVRIRLLWDGNVRFIDL